MTDVIDNTARIAELERLIGRFRDGIGLATEQDEVRWSRELRQLRGEPESPPVIVPAWLAVPAPAPKPYVKPPKKRKKTVADHVPNPCRCHGGKPGPKAKRALDAYDLCPNGPTPEISHACQVYQLFRLALYGEVTTTVHVCMDVDGMLRNGFFGGLIFDGRELPPEQVKAELLRLKADGVKLIPTGGCDSFSQESGCPGHMKPPHPADYVKDRHWFEPTQDDREHLEWICWLNTRAWLTTEELRLYGGIPERVRTPRPANWLALSQDECRAFGDIWRAEDAAYKDAIDAVVIVEDSLVQMENETYAELISRKLNAFLLAFREAMVNRKPEPTRREILASLGLSAEEIERTVTPQRTTHYTH